MALQDRRTDRQWSLSRRSVLAAGAAAIGSIAGCTDADRSSDSDFEEDRFPDEEEIYDGATVLTVRYNTGDRGVIEVDEETHRRGRRYVIDEEDVEALSFPREPIDADPDAPKAFLEAIDYDEASALVLSDRVGGCTRHQLQYVKQRGGGGLRVQFCRTYRDPEIECSTDDSHTQLTLIEVPEPFDHQPSGFGRGRSSSCRLPPDHPGRDVEYTEIDGDRDAF